MRILAAAALATIAAPALAEPTYPDCNDPALLDQFDGTHQDCWVQFPDQQGLVVIVDFEPSENGESVHVIFVREIIADEFRTEIESTFAYPIIEDLNGDGWPEVQVIQYTGNANSYGVLYHLGDAGRWIINAELPLTPDEDGHLTSWNRSNAAEGTVTYYDFGAEGLEAALTIDVNFAAIQEGNLDDGCRISGTPSALGLTVDAIVEKHCSL